MKLNEIVNEQSVNEAVSFDYSDYKASQGGEPKGKGQWFFGTSKDPNMDDESQVFRHTGTFAEAKKKANQWAQKHGHDRIYVLG